jgi:hypothetical protein
MNHRALSSAVTPIVDGDPQQAQRIAISGNGSVWNFLALGWKRFLGFAMDPAHPRNCGWAAFDFGWSGALALQGRPPFAAGFSR